MLVDGKPERTVRVSDDRLYTLVERPKIGDHLLELRFTPGCRRLRVHVRVAQNPSTSSSVGGAAPAREH